MSAAKIGHLFTKLRNYLDEVDREHSGPAPSGSVLRFHPPLCGRSIKPVRITTFAP